ncbi:thiol:disulfide interchange protein DsbC [Salinisphaera sp. PC39]|uniref:DsbC family protein n=1 Tax=Salinisphaera sp. PC39 TaxID=1304156 RepID=UPI00333EBAFF
MAERPRLAALALTLFAAAGTAADLLDPAFRDEVAARIPGVSGEDIAPSPVPGIYRVRRGESIGYLTADGRYLFDGDLIELGSGENLSDTARREWRREILAGVPESSMLVYEPADGASHTLTVFTDVDCRYCRRLHADIDTLLAAGIRVRYLFYPLAGPESSSFEQARAVWCADEPRRALGRAMAGETLASAGAACDDPVMDHLRLAAETLGLDGTPGLIAGDGRLLPPRSSARELADLLGRGPDGDRQSGR